MSAEGVDKGWAAVEGEAVDKEAAVEGAADRGHDEVGLEAAAIPVAGVDDRNRIAVVVALKEALTAVDPVGYRLDDIVEVVVVVVVLGMRNRRRSVAVAADRNTPRIQAVAAAGVAAADNSRNRNAVAGQAQARTAVVTEGEAAEAAGDSNPHIPEVAEHAL